MNKQEFLNGQIVLFNCDCIDVMRNLKDKEIDLVLTDPPYGINFGVFNRTNKLNNGQRIKANKYHNANWDNNIPDNCVFDELLRISKNSIIWGGNYFPKLWQVAGRCFIFWKKNNPVPNFADGELAWTSFDKVAKCFDFNYYGNQEGKTLAESKIHPTQKPVALMSWCLNNYSQENDLIFDGFLGSGTTAIACIRTKRRLIGCELDNEYFDKMCKRIEEELRQGNLF